MIEVRNLTRYYGDFAALNDVSFELAEGEIVGLLGRNGAGKSTALMMLAGLLAPSSGTVHIDGTDLSTDPSLRGRIGVLTEEPPLYTEMTVTAFLRHIGRINGMAAEHIERRLPIVIETADLGGREEQVIGTLSHGYKKRVGIAQAIIHEPKLVILDEPISGLDPAQIVEMRKVVRNLGKSHAVIISSHILSEVSQTCDRILVIGNGELVAQGTESELNAMVDKAKHAEKLLVTVRDPDGTFADFLGKSDHVTASDVKQAPSGMATAQIEMDGDQREELLADIVKAGFGLRRVVEPEDELEEIFLGLTQEAA